MLWEFSLLAWIEVLRDAHQDFYRSRQPALRAVFDGALQSRDQSDNGSLRLPSRRTSLYSRTPLKRLVI